ncbi:alpha/beta hydrolase family esterase [Tropicimonas sp. S265A]|uniref:extracellular catalytic domain type 1 short-chain-length polyhydroxyalkanoate depolymerase n=1 Tax=Tropicimonas sp. S265A TaxID=3415134 RepID=UPI003C7B1727
MFTFNVGAKRPADDDARTSRIAAANDLVQQTLARHGLLGGATHPTDAPATPNLSAMKDLLSRVQSTTKSPVPIDIPDGASFETATFSCSAGQRSYRCYVPSSATTGATGLVLMLHGCTQTPEDFAIGTGMNALAETHGFVVIYPQQSRGDNAQSCWNWFSRGDQRRDRGEPAILAGLTREIAARYTVPATKTYVAGLSAGGAMAVVMGETYPDVFSGVGVHSGLPYGAAKDVASAFALMAGTNAPDQQLACNTAIPTIVFHGQSDKTVHPANGDLIARQVASNAGPQMLETIEKGECRGRAFERLVASTPQGQTMLEHWTVEDLGHAWSGGQSGGSYTDTAGPDASGEMVRFFLSL